MPLANQMVPQDGFSHFIIIYWALVVWQTLDVLVKTAVILI